MGTFLRFTKENLSNHVWLILIFSLALLVYGVVVTLLLFNTGDTEVPIDNSENKIHALETKLEQCYNSEYQKLLNSLNNKKEG